MQVTKKPKENSASLIRRFTQRVRESRILLNAKKSRFYDQGLSRNRRRKNALERVKNRAIKVRLKKMGKI
jgi:ribosomal protein S21